MSQWIWKFGEFEIYHNELLHNRRVQYGYREAPVWKIYSPDSAVRFKKEITTEGGELRITACGYFTVKIFCGGKISQYGGRNRIKLEPGTYLISITVSNTEAFPCLYVDGVVASDESWLADDLTADNAPVGTASFFNSPEKTPLAFPFQYKRIEYTVKESVNNGLLFNFGRETFARTVISMPQDTGILVSFGESREEALDAERSVIHYCETTTERMLKLPPSAFRYIFVDRPDADISAEYEYLPLEYKGSFKCGEEIVNKVWDIAAYTFHLNSREFFLDGIKRDRWVWSADAYQSLFVNRYLFFDRDIEKRTLTALGGKAPVKAHINTIMDYSFFWFISLYDYYITYGDRRFLEQIFPQAREYMAFCRSRADEDGFVREKPGDWIFIDWAPMDKTGAVCGEQILFAKALECYSKICEVISRDDEGCKVQSENLILKIKEYFFLDDKGVFIDSYESGKNNITRHSNILAYLFLPLTDSVKDGIYKNVILNDSVRQITTPYFKFYENQVHCEAGNGILLEESLRKYYGSMLETGATTLYEEYDPTKTGAEHYAMYGSAYEKSLCHAWSASPIYLLGRYRLGVKNTGIAYDTFDVEPNPGDLDEFDGTVPVPGGTVSVRYRTGSISVLSTVTGGTLVLGGKRISLNASKELAMQFRVPK